MWVDGPSGEPWEIYTVLADVEMPAGELRTAEPESDVECCAAAPESAARVAGRSHDLGRSLSAAFVGTAYLELAIVVAPALPRRGTSPGNIGLQLARESTRPRARVSSR